MVQPQCVVLASCLHVALPWVTTDLGLRKSQLEFLGKLKLFKVKNALLFINTGTH